MILYLLAEQRENDFSSNTKSIRAFKYLFLCYLCIHVITCGWFALSCNGIHSDKAEIRCLSGSWANDVHVSFGNYSYRIRYLLKTMVLLLF